jgi:moderate conductance mechanosensitive channel
MAERWQRLLNLTIDQVPSVALTLLAAILSLWLVKRLARRVVSSDTPFNRRSVRLETLRKVLTSALTVFIYVLCGTAILGELGVNVAALLAGVGILGLAVSFGAQSLVKDVITGFFILLEDQYGIGDVVRVNGSQGMSGAVESLNLRVTVLRDLEGTAHILPNSEIKTVSVLSKDWARVVGDVDVPHEYPLEDALKLVTGIATALHEDPAWGDKFLEPPELLGTQALTPTGATVRVLMKVLPKEQWGVAREFKRRVKNEFERLGLRSSLPQMSLALPAQARVVTVEEGGGDAPLSESR